ASPLPAGQRSLPDGNAAAGGTRAGALGCMPLRGEGARASRRRGSGFAGGGTGGVKRSPAPVRSEKRASRGTQNAAGHTIRNVARNRDGRRGKSRKPA